MVIGGSLLSLATPWEHTAMTTTPSFEALLRVNKRVNRSTLQPQDPARSFYHLAAALAHQDSDSLMGSALLESDYQDCLLSFSARGQRLNAAKAKNHLMSALNKFLISAR